MTVEDVGEARQHHRPHHALGIMVAERDGGGKRLQLCQPRRLRLAEVVADHLALALVDAVDAVTRFVGQQRFELRAASRDPLPRGVGKRDLLAGPGDALHQAQGQVDTGIQGVHGSPRLRRRRGRAQAAPDR